MTNNRPTTSLLHRRLARLLPIEQLREMAEAQGGILLDVLFILTTLHGLLLQEKDDMIRHLTSTCKLMRPDDRDEA